MTNEVKCDSGLSSASTERAGGEADVACTASAQIAEWIAEIEAKIEVYYKQRFSISLEAKVDAAFETKRRLRSILDAINAGQV